MKIDALLPRSRSETLSADSYPIEFRSVYDSTVTRLRAFFRAVWSRSLSGLEGVPGIVVQAPVGGGASEIARVIASHIARARNGWLTFPAAEAQGAQPASGSVVVFGPYAACCHLLRGTSESRVVSFCNGQLTNRQMRILMELGYIVLDVPAIWSRNEDSLLVTKMVQRESFPPGVELSECALTLIRDYRWPGDLAHLRMTLGLAGQQAFLVGSRTVFADALLAIMEKKEFNLGPLCIADQFGWGFSIRSMDMLNLAQFCGYGRVKKAMERWMLEGAHSAFAGDCAAAARSLQLPYTTLVSRLKSLGISEHGNSGLVAGRASH